MHLTPDLLGFVQHLGFLVHSCTHECSPQLSSPSVLGVSSQPDVLVCVFMDGVLKRYPVLSSLNPYSALMGQQGQPWLSPPALCPPPRHASSFPSTTLTPHQPFGS